MLNIERLATKIYEIFLSINAIEKYTLNVTKEEFLKNIEKQDALDMRFIHIGECACKIKNINMEFVQRYSNIAWKDMYDFRNVIAHDYIRIKPEKTWNTIQNDIPVLKNELFKMLEKESEIKALVIEENNLDEKYKFYIGLDEELTTKTQLKPKKMKM